MYFTASIATFIFRFDKLSINIRMKAILAVFIGGGFGSLLRYFINKWVSQTYTTSFPLATFLVNSMGCFLIGFLIMFIGKSYPLPIKLLLITGFCGGFTTFSAFAFENVELMQNQQIGLALFYTICSVIIGILFTWFGIIVGKGFV